jgi:hypothetical protein
MARPSIVALGAAFAFAIGTWLAFGWVALYGPDTSPRLALPGPLWILVVAAVAAFAYVFLRRPTPRDAAPLWLPALALLPWLPLPLPAAALLWTGPLARGLAFLAGAAVIAPLLRELWRRGFSPAMVGEECDDAQAKAWAHVRLAFGLAAVLYLAAAWRLSPVLPSGDEPHYLVIAESLLRDGDLRIENNHASRGYLAYVDGELKPDYLRRGRDRQIYSIHAPGLPALIVPAFALGGYPGVVVFLALLSAFGAALAWRAAFEITGDITAAWVGWAAVALSAPFFFQAFTVFPDAPAAVIVMFVAYALVRGDWLTSSFRIGTLGAALAILPWLHTRYSLIAGAAAVVIVLRVLSAGKTPAGHSFNAGDGRQGAAQAKAWAYVRGLTARAEARAYVRLLAFFAIPLVSAAAWLWMFQQIYGTFDPRAPYGGSPEMRLARIPIGLTGLLIDQQFGLLPNAPIYLIALGALVTLAKYRRRLAIELVAIAAPYVVAVAAFHMWWAGLSSPARFLVPVLLPLSMPLSVFWRRHVTTTPRAATAMLLMTSLGITAIVSVAAGGTMLYNTRDGFARWLDWIAPAVNLSYALPSLFQESVTAAWMKAFLWFGGLAAGWFALCAAKGWVASASSIVFAVIGCAAISVGATGGWLVSGRGATEPGSSAIAMLGEVCGAERAALRVAPFSMSTGRSTDPEFGIRDAGRRPLSTSGPPWTARDLPSGRYRLWLDSGLNVSGALTLALGKPDSALQQCTFAEHRPGPTECVVDLPAGATWLWMTPDAAMRSSIEGLRLQLVSPGAAETCSLRADRVVVTPAGVVFAEKGSVYAEPSGLWVIGGKTARLTIQSRGDRTLAIRNGPVANVVRFGTGSERVRYQLAPGEHLPIRLAAPPLQNGMALTVSSEAGFRPGDLEAGNRDLRYLGLWVELR